MIRVADGAAPPAAGSVTTGVALIAVAFGLLCSAVAYVIYYRLIADVGPTRALTVTRSMAVGAATVLVGTFLVAVPRRRGAPTAAPTPQTAGETTGTPGSADPASGIPST